MSISVLLWDFGDTLVDESWIRRAPIGCATWESSWADVMADLADDWDVGVVTSAIVFQALASRTGMSAEDVEAPASAVGRSSSIPRYGGTHGAGAGHKRS